VTSFTFGHPHEVKSRMKLTGAAALVVIVVAACAGTTPSQSPSPSGLSAGRSPGPGDATWNFDIAEIGLGGDGYVALKNFTDLRSSLGALYLCQAEGCVDLPDEVIEPGGIARIAVGSGEGLADVVRSHVELVLAPADGEIALSVNADVRMKADLRSYVQWGSTPHELTELADQAALWPKTSYAPSAPHATRLWKTEASLWVWDPGQ
jgi:hypothetical protein